MKDENKLGGFYSHVRCGLFHNGMSDGELVISNDFDLAIRFKGDDIQINARELILVLKNDFEQYICELKNFENNNLRDNFNKMFVVT